MPIFPQTPRSVLRRLGENCVEEERLWARFVELYDPAIRSFIHLQEPDIPPEDVDDLVQESLARLVPVIRDKAYDFKKGRFCTLVAVTVRRLIIDRARARTVRRAEHTIPLDEAELETTAPSVAALIDMKWRLARHHAAIEQVFTKSALSDQSRRAYMLIEVDGLSITEVAAKLNLQPNAVRRIVSRVRKMIAGVEAEYE